MLDIEQILPITEQMRAIQNHYFFPTYLIIKISFFIVSTYKIERYTNKRIGASKQLVLQGMKKFKKKKNYWRRNKLSLQLKLKNFLYKSI